MVRYKITIEYDGTGLAGWQRQDEVYSVQESLQNALFKFSQEEVNIQCAGRTDAGVHAFGQVAHFDLQKDWEAFRVQDAMNNFLRDDLRLPHAGQVAVIDCEKVDDDFNARFSAKKRYYKYRIVNRRAHLAIDANRAWCVYEKLDAEAMHEAAQILVGHHDFSSFRAAACQAKSPVKTIDKIEVKRIGDEIFIDVEAQSFLHHQIRNFAGSLKLVGLGKWAKADLQKALDAKDRAVSGATAASCGLYFVKVDY